MSDKNILTPRKALNKAFLKMKPLRSDITLFKNNLGQLLNDCNESESEEFHKTLLNKFLDTTYYSGKHFINTKGRNDLVIHNGKDAKSPVAVIIETKKPKNKTEMPQPGNLNAKAMQELVLYYLRERISANNLELKQLIATDIFEWYVFDAQLFEKLFASDKKLVQLFNDFESGRLGGNKTDFFYKEVAAPAIEAVKDSICFTHFNISDFEKALRNTDIADDNKLIVLQKIFSPEHLLKKPFSNDSNSLNKAFYNELLHIIGLTETKEGSKKIIIRKKEADRDAGSLLENAIAQIDNLDKLSYIPNPSRFGDSNDERMFNLGLEVCITWINRILFLKLLEAQMLSYHKGNPENRFLSIDKIGSFDELNQLFFSVLAKLPDERNARVKARFAKVPYLNSSLFETSEIEQQSVFISNLSDEVTLPLIANSVLKRNDRYSKAKEINTLEYLFEFLDAYDFSSDGSGEIQEDNKNLINASVLGLIFEKINGYRDGSFFTPGFITMYMCHETIRRAVVQKFNETKGWSCNTLDELYNKIEDSAEANRIVNSIKICDPAVGSGHFLVSALNELISVKSDLRILCDRDGRRLKEYNVEIQNDELILTDEDGDIFEYKPGNKESQRVQEALFHEKQTLIENCLFGVDINPNSVKICRLRLWIELLKSAYYKNSVTLSGVEGLTELETLPNIDINIKCGNSLISRYALDADIKQALKKSKWNIDSYRLAIQSYREASSKETKREMEKLINQIKSDFESEIAINDKRLKQLNLLKGELVSLTTEVTMFDRSAKEKTAWNKKVEKLAGEITSIEKELEEIKSNKIYDNAFEWRFEFPEVLNDDGDFVGFDVVIGNPPYGSLFSETEKLYIKSNYQFCDYQFDIYMTFFERSHTLLKKYCHLCFIVPNTWLLNLKTPNIRRLLFSNFNTYNLRAYNYPVFDEAIVDTIIVSTKKKIELAEKMVVQIIDQYGDFIENQFVLKELAENHQSPVNIYLSDSASKIDFKLSKLLKLDDVAKITQGAKPFQKGKGKPKQDEKTMCEKPFVQSYRKDETFRPLLRGSLINKYIITWDSDYYISLGEWLAEPRYSANYDAPEKIVIRQTGSSLIATIDSRQFVVRDNLYTIISTNKQYSEYFLLACLNSKLMNWYYQNIVNNEVGEALAQVKRGHLEVLPIPSYNLSLFGKTESLIKQILNFKQADKSSDTSNLEYDIDRLVYELYGLSEEEIGIVEGER